jgi:uncharacterized protein YjbI with pentapeptide repeats
VQDLVQIDLSIVAAAVALAAAVLGGAWWLWWRLPMRQVARLRFTIRDPKARADVEDNFRKTIGQLLGGAAVLIGAALAYIQFTQQQQTSQRQFTQQQQASHDLLISNQVAKGFEQLGSDKVVVRLGGIYALEGVMNTSAQYHQPVLEALSAFVRDGTRTEGGSRPPATEIQAALTVIGRRSAGTGLVDLTGAHIPKASLRKAKLSDTNLSGADLMGANLRGANLMGANLINADLSGADLMDANLSGAYLMGAKLINALLMGANLRGAGLSMMDPVSKSLSEGSLTNLTGASLAHADLSGSNVSQTQLDETCLLAGSEVKLPPGLSLKPCP